MIIFNENLSFFSPLRTPFLDFFGLDARKNLFTKFGMTYVFMKKALILSTNAYFLWDL